MGKKPQSYTKIWDSFLFSKEELLWERHLELIQWWLLAKLLSVFSSGKQEDHIICEYWSNYLGVYSTNVVWFLMQARLRQLDSQGDMSLKYHLHFCRVSRENQPPPLPLWRMPSANTWITRVTMTSEPFLCCCQDKIKFPDRLSLIYG